MAFASQRGMKIRTQAVALAFLLLGVSMPAAADWLEKVKHSTPFGMADEAAQREGLWRGLRAGSERIYKDGRWEVLFSGYAWHMPFEYSAEERDEYNERAWGLGLTRRVLDERDNERLLFALVTQDSHSKPQYMAGYAWLARWRLSESLRFGAGYAAFVMGRSNYGPGNYIPFPAVLPLVSFGTDRVSLMATYVPGISRDRADGNVLFVFARLGF